MQGNCIDMMMEGADSCMNHEEIQSVSVPCIVPNVTGRGFIEVKFFFFPLSWTYPVPFFCEWNLILQVCSYLIK